MDGHPSDLAFTPAVKAQQERLGSRALYERLGEGAGWDTTITPRRAEFIAARDSFYLASASADGRPYIQHRGGAPGFLRILDETTLAFPDYPGNRQYITIGNLAENDRVCLFLMDYPGRQRLKLWGRARFVEDDPELVARVTDPGSRETVERVIVIDVEVMDGNCPKYIRPRFTEEHLSESVETLRARIRALEAQVDGCCPEAGA